MNRVTLFGNVGADPEVRSLDNGNKVANFSLATTERWKDKDGNKQEATEWHRVQVWGNALIDNVIAKYVKKGSKLLVEGKIVTRKWQDQEGKDRYSTEIVGQQIQLAGDAGGNGGSRPPMPDEPPAGRRIDDDIPF